MKMSSGEDTKTKLLVPLLCLVGAGIVCTAAATAINKWKSVRKSEQRHQLYGKLLENPDKPLDD